MAATASPLEDFPKLGEYSTATTFYDEEYEEYKVEDSYDSNWAFDVLAFVAATLGAYAGGAIAALTIKAIVGYLRFFIRTRCSKEKFDDTEAGVGDEPRYRAIYKTAPTIAGFRTHHTRPEHSEVTVRGSIDEGWRVLPSSNILVKNSHDCAHCSPNIAGRRTLSMTTALIYQPNSEVVHKVQESSTWTEKQKLTELLMNSSDQLKATII